MKVTLIASVSANGKVLLANNPNHQIAPEVMEFLVQKAVESGNIIFWVFYLYHVYRCVARCPCRKRNRRAIQQSRSPKRSQNRSYS